jgi:hypothetical protein
MAVGARAPKVKEGLRTGSSRKHALADSMRRAQHSSRVSPGQRRYLRAERGEVSFFSGIFNAENESWPPAASVLCIPGAPRRG